MPPSKNYLLYDGACPFCTSFSKFYALKQALPDLSIVSMRDAVTLKRLNLPKDLDFNQGMVLVLADGTILQGERAFSLVNKNVEKSSLRDRIVVGVTSVPWISKLVYPVLFQFRKVILNHKKIPTHLSRVDLQ